ncbi:MAG TPA: hypothetical protein VEI97_12385, partial [bacterium]|nr:hypothetical protein [bacterium]
LRPDALNPFRGVQSQVRLWAVPAAWFKQEGITLLGYILAVVIVTQIVLQVRRRAPWVWALLPATAALFVAIASPANIQEAIPYQYAEWNILRFNGKDNRAQLYSTFWVSNLSRHNTPLTLTHAAGPDFMFDEFVYVGAGVFSDDPDAYETVHVRQGAQPAFTQLVPLSMSFGQVPSPVTLPRVVIGWGPTTVPGSLTGTFAFKGDGQPATLTVTNGTPWHFTGGSVLLHSEHLSVSFDGVPGIAPGDTATVEVPADRLIFRPDLTSPRTDFGAPLPPWFREMGATEASWGASMVELLDRQFSMGHSLMFTEPLPEFAYVPEAVQIVGQLDGYLAPVTLDNREPTGRRLTLVTAPARIEWGPGTRPTQEPYSWEYY